MTGTPFSREGAFDGSRPLAYARRLRDAGFSDEQAEGQAEALAAAMTDSLATKQDLVELELRTDGRLRDMRHEIASLRSDIDSRFGRLENHLGTLLAEQEKRFTIRIEESEARTGIRLSELEQRLDLRIAERIADLDRRLTVRMLMGITVVSALSKLL